jgi:hypothetical protein
MGAVRGLVEIRGSNGESCDITLDSAGLGQCELVSGTPGTTTLAALYRGFRGFDAAIASATHTIIPAALEMAASASGSVSEYPSPRYDWVREVQHVSSLQIAHQSIDDPMLRIEYLSGDDPRLKNAPWEMTQIPAGWQCNLSPDHGNSAFVCSTTTAAPGTYSFHTRLELRGAGPEPSDPGQVVSAIAFTEAGGYRVEIDSPTDQTPEDNSAEWLPED